MTVNHVCPTDESPRACDSPPPPDEIPFAYIHTLWYVSLVYIRGGTTSLHEVTDCVLDRASLEVLRDSGTLHTYAIECFTRMPQNASHVCHRKALTASPTHAGTSLGRVIPTNERPLVGESSEDRPWPRQGPRDTVDDLSSTTAFPLLSALTK